MHTIESDRGPLSKYLGALAPAVPPTATVVVGDDDMYYGRTFVEDYACAVAAGPRDTVYSSGLWDPTAGPTARPHSPTATPQQPHSSFTAAPWPHNGPTGSPTAALQQHHGSYTKLLLFHCKNQAK